MNSRPLLWIRSLGFYIGLVLSTLLWGTVLTVLALFFPYRYRMRLVIRPWVGFVLWWLRVTCSIRVQINGLDHLGCTPGVLFFKHMSTWDALFSQMIVAPLTTVIKKGLLWIPCFGWAFWVTRPIPILRNQPVKAFKQLLTLGQQRLADGYWVALFPEGARIKPGRVERFQIGGARLVKESGCCAYVVAHNGGHHWQHKHFTKQPGTIQVRISPPITANNRPAEDLNEELEGWMREQMKELDPATED